MSRPLRPHQVEAIGRLRDALRSGRRRVMLSAPTGAGKTRIMAAIVEGALARGKRVVVTVPAISLVDQTVVALEEEGIDAVGVVQGFHERSDLRQPVQVCSVQTLMRRFIPPADVVVVDEAHLWFQFYERWFSDPEWLTVPIIGLSATPWTKGLGKHYDELIVVRTTQDLIDQGYLSPFRVFAPSHPDLKGVRTRGGDYNEADLAGAMNKPSLVADVVATWVQRGEDRPTLCFGVDRAHAKALQSQFLAQEIPAGYIDAFTDLDERKEIGRKFHAGELKVVCNVATLTTGIDWDVRCIILARPTKSTMLFVQIIGRGLRRAPGKADCIARGTPILTDQGEVPIERLTLAHRVWDGTAFVRHGGAVCRGVQPVMSFDGLTATPDHRVMTDEGWMQIAEAARHGRRIARTGVGGQPIRLSDHRVAEGGGLDLESSGRRDLRPLHRDAYGQVSQPQETAGYSGMPALQWAAAGDGTAMALPSLPGSAGPVPQPFVDVIRALWRAWHRISFPRAERSGALDRGELGHSCSIYANRSDQQQRPLRTRQSPVGYGKGEYEQSTYEVAEVWDVLNAGPRHCFTANGRLVHNCLILDHSDTTLRLGFVTDITQDWLDDGKGRGPVETRGRDEPQPKECPSCKFVKPARVSLCPNCGFKPQKQSKVECEDGELIELTDIRKGKNGKPRMLSLEQRRELFGQLRQYGQEKQYRRGWAKRKFIDLTGIWPDGVENARPMPPSPALLSWIRSQNIRWAKGRAAHGR